MHSYMDTHEQPLSRRLGKVLLPFVLLLSLLWPVSPVHAATQPVTVTIWFLEQWGDLDLTTLGDFYAEITINGVQQTTPQIEFLPPGGYIVPSGNLLSDPWVISLEVPEEAVTVPVMIEIWESDWPDGDDHADAAAEGDDILLTVNLDTGKWTGTVNWPEICSQGSTNFDGRGVKVCFDINTISVGGDADQDGLLDNWEQKGVDFDLNGTIDLDLPMFGANPLRKDVFVELDCLLAGDHSHCPRQDSVEDVAYSFARAPVFNLDGTTGVQLHVDVGPLYGDNAIAPAPGPGGAVSTYGDFGGGNTIPEAGNEIIESINLPKGNGVPFADLKDNNFDPNREPIFHYGIFGHQTNFRQATGDCTSGEASDIPGHDFMVTLGGGPFPDVPTFPCWGTDANGFSVGSRSEQAGTFQHELGHTIGLEHGGNQSIPNNKPNYLSVMNYAFQVCNIMPSPNGVVVGGCDYSRVDLPSPGVPLDESSLDECVGLGPAGGYGFFDWDQDGLIEGMTNCQPPNNANVSRDINGDGIQTLLRGFEDWNNLNYIDGLSGAGDYSGVPDEADPQTIQDAQDQLGDQMAPVLVVTKTGPPTAVPEDEVDYTVEVENDGFGPAFDAVLTDTNPDGASQQIVLGDILVGETRTHEGSFTVPADACPGDFTEATAEVTYYDIVGRELSASGSAPLEILDIEAPTLRVTATPSVLWPPDHKFVEVTAAIEVTDNCDEAPIITLVSITSNEPATGFLGNGDKGPDIIGAAYGTDDRIFSLRSERATGGDHTGRIYTITYRATDASGNSTEATVIVTVPTDATGLP